MIRSITKQIVIVGDTVTDNDTNESFVTFYGKGGIAFAASSVEEAVDHLNAEYGKGWSISEDGRFISRTVLA